MVAPLHAITGVNATYAWGSQQQQAFNEIKKALINATALAQPDSEGEFIQDTDAQPLQSLESCTSGKVLLESDALNQLSMVAKKLTATQAKYGAPKVEMYAACHFIVRNHG